MFFIVISPRSPRNVSWRFSRLPHRKGLLRSTQRMHVGKPKVLRRVRQCGNRKIPNRDILRKGGNHTGDMTTMVDNAWGLRAVFIQFSLIWQGNWMGLADEKISLCQPKHNSLPAEAQVGFNLSSAKKKGLPLLLAWKPSVRLDAFLMPCFGKVGSKLRAKGRSAEEKKL